MPQKKNYDLFEIMRANGKVLVGYFLGPPRNHRKGRPRIAGSIPFSWEFVAKKIWIMIFIKQMRG
jgi:hypothetical protein